MQFLSAPWWGRLSDRIGRRPVILASLIATAISYVVFGLATSLPVLFASRIFAGISGGVIPTTMAYIADTTTPANRTKGMGLIGAAFGLGFIFGPALGGILSRYGYAVPSFAAAGFALLSALFAFVFLPESLPKEARAAAALRRAAAPTIVVVLRRPALRPIFALFFIGTLCFSALEGTFALFGEHRYHLGPAEVGYLLAFVGAVSALMQAGLVGWLARRFGERALVFAGFLLMATGMGFAGTGPALAFLITAMGVLTVGSGLATPSLAGLASVAAGAEEQGGVLGIYQSLGSLARAVGPFLGGLAFDNLGIGSPLWLGGIVLAIASMLALQLPRRRPIPGG
jgi:MFS family permease